MEPLDLTGLEPPGPMLEIMKGLEGLRSGETLAALLAREPVFLLPKLEEAGHGFTLRELGDGRWELRITKG